MVSPSLARTLSGMVAMALLLAAPVAAQDGADFSQGLTGLGDAGAEQAARAAHQQADAAAAEAVQAVAPGTLGAGDKLKVTVFGEDDLSGTFEIGSSGSLALPLVGGISATGLTPRQLEGRITRALGNGYLVNPRVTVEVLTFRPVFVLGEVNKPGSYPYANAMTVVKAVALAGGYTPRARTGRVKVRRASDASRTEVEAAENARVYPGDVVRVMERFF